MSGNKELQQLIANKKITETGVAPKDEVVLVAMVRDLTYGEPTTADVHPDEVANWQEYGWVIAE